MKNNVNLCAIAAVSLDGVIGIGDLIPWKISNDLKHYKNTTTGNYVIVGGKTYLTLPNSAKENRQYLILTKNPNYYNDNVKTFTSVSDLIEFIETNEELNGKTVYVAGGEKIYNQLIDYCDSAIITWVSKVYPNGNKLFPINNILNDFDDVEEMSWRKDSDDEPTYKITKYQRIR